MCKSFFMALLAILGFYVKAQEEGVPDAQVISYVPPSPNASSLGQYGEIPVSYYTGTPNISIPLYTVQGRDINVPISLSYHASGIKVSQRSGMVGLGWALNAGGVITRTIKGKRDEHTSFGYNHIQDDILAWYNSTMTVAQEQEFEHNCARGLYDCEPDVYFYNFQGKSGKMVFNKNGKVNLIPHKKLRVTGNTAIGFTITDTDGTAYEFKEIGYSEIVPYGDANSEGGNTSWFLTKIISTRGEEITFEYSRSTEVYDLTLSESYRTRLIGSTSPFSFCKSEPILNGSQYDGDLIEVSRIHAPNIQVNLDRTGIEVYRKTDLINPILEWDFLYGTFAHGRRKLTNVTEKNGSISKPPFSFHYYEPTGLPNYDSFDQDHWGYWNDNDEDTFLPELTVGGTTYFGGNREPHATRTKAFSLEKITYPTGGRTEFTFEPHDYGYVKSSTVSNTMAGGLRIQKITNFTSGNAKANTKVFEYLEGNNSSGVLLTTPEYSNYNYTYSYTAPLGDGSSGVEELECRSFNRTATNKSTIGTTQGSHIGYRSVTEYFEESKLEGKTVYEYTSPYEYPDYTSLNPVAHTSFDFKRGLLEKRTDYVYKNGVYEKSREIDPRYVFRNDVNYSEQVGVSFTYSHRSTFSNTPEDQGILDAPYQHISQWYYMDQQIEKMYGEDGNTVTRTTNYTYDNANHLQPTTITTSASGGEIRTTDLYYVEDLYSGSHVLKTNHMHTQVLLEDRFVNGNATYTSQSTYEDISGAIVKTTDEIFPTGSAEKYAVNYGYDDFGNVVEVQVENEESTTYLWSYNHSLPVAKIDFATRSQIVEALNLSGGLTLLNSLSAASDQTTINTTLSTIRNVLNPVLPNAHITTYLYHTGYGLLEQTDPRGVTTTYQYDELGRLYQIKDQDSYVIQEFDYNYKN